MGVPTNGDRRHLQTLFVWMTARVIILHVTETFLVFNNSFYFMEFLKTEEIHMSAHHQSANSYVSDLLNTA